MTYTVGDEIGRGTFGIVSNATDDSGDSFAIKILNDESFPDSEKGMLRKRFEREVRYQQQVDHRNVVPILDHNLDDDPPWFVMPLAIRSLADDLREDKTLSGEPHKPLFDILAGLQALHESGLCHRDLKPANVLKFEDEAGDKYYSISDFGLTTPGVGQTSTLTESGMGGGTPLYRPPECANNFRRATDKADIYSFGAILHDIFSGGVGRIPHNELSVPGPLKEIIEKCTKANPRRRYRNVATLREELFEVLDNTVVEFHSQEEEEVIKILNDADELSDDNWDRVFYLLDDNADKGQKNNNIFRAIKSEQILSLHASAPDMFHGLGELFAEYAQSSAFNFDYCDVIAGKAQIFYNNGEMALKALVALAMLELGTTHNRWYVENMFVGMADGNISEPLAKRMVIEIKASQIPFLRRIIHLEKSIHKSREDLHPVLQNFIAEVDS